MNNNDKVKKWTRGKGWYPYKRRGTSNVKKPGPIKTVNSEKSVSKTTSNQIKLDTLLFTGPYKGWKLYHPQEEFKEDSKTHSNIKTAESYILKNYSSFNFSPEKSKFIEIDLIHLMEDEIFSSSWSSFEENLSNEPYYTLNCLGLAAHQVFNAEEKITVRPINHQLVIPLTDFKGNYLGKLITVKGTIIRVGSPGLLCKSIDFQCNSCHQSQPVIQPLGIYTLPTSCIFCKNGSKFEPLYSSPLTKTIDCQIIRIQETQMQGMSGSIPKNVEVELHNDLVNIVSPGDTISITGIVQVRGDGRGEDNKKGARFMHLYLEAVNIHNIQNHNHPNLKFTSKDYQAIQEIHSSDSVFRLLVQSLCPSIFGQEIVKAGLLLGLMGGSENNSGSRINPHILIVGDPGLGKSQLLQATTLIAPRGVYACGNACSASGLTVSLSRESEGFNLEAGALVLADCGICCVDELDKLNPSSHGALLEAMEQGTVSVARGGVVCRLAASPTILAAANPTQGHFNKNKTICENLRMSSPLLSRFDLVFILLDCPDEHIDALLSDHVLALYSNEDTKTSFFNPSLICQSTQNNEQTLNKRLKIQNHEHFEPLSPTLLRKYIAYAKKYVHPKLNENAALIIKDFYLKLRSAYKKNLGAAPVTTRQLEACVRLTQARARVCLREKATEEDAKDAIDIMKYSLFNFLNENLEFTQPEINPWLNSKSKTKKFIALILQQMKKMGQDIFNQKELIEIHKLHKLSGDPISLIESLHNNGYLLLKSPNVYRVLNL